MKRVIVMQGVSGAGKSTYVKKHFPDAWVCSADDYFVDSQTGTYKFDPSKIGEAHKHCMQVFLDSAMQRQELIVVDNTNSQLWELSPYIMLAAALEYTVVVIRVTCPPEVAAIRNVHGVPGGVVHNQDKYMQKPLKKWPCTYKEVSG